MIQEAFTGGFNSIVSQAGRPITVRYFNEVIGSVWDDDTILTQSGADVVTSGIVMVMNTQEGSQDSVLVQQGKLQDNDKRLFVNGSLLITGSDSQCKIFLGSVAGDVYSTIPLGGIAPEVEGIPIYKKVYIRRLTNGSLIGE